MKTFRNIIAGWLVIISFITSITLVLKGNEGGAFGYAAFTVIAAIWLSMCVGGALD